MSKYYLAIDIGASSGRHMLASIVNGKIQLEEVYRFPNGMDNKNGTLCWSVRLTVETYSSVCHPVSAGRLRHPPGASGTRLYCSAW